MSRDRRYPLPAKDDDDRFTFGLVVDVADVLARHRYPELASGDDFVALQQALFRFLYTTSTEPYRLDPTTEES
ncbi:hypothetical protein [Amycolatopsis mediterranei]|nr:hypothetical protein [Amycolatopsis mediterranei]UZF72911.1 hypothetical protein ISP_006308 [Amycolatopsis mediterranei]